LHEYQKKGDAGEAIRIVVKTREIGKSVWGGKFAVVLVKHEAW
jgi:hypothetical protein